VGKPIVVGVDGSENAVRAARYAAKLAGLMQSSLVLVHVVPSLAVPADAIAFGAQLLQAHRVRGEALLDMMVNQLESTGLKIEKRLADSGAPAEVLADVANQVGAELIVVGDTGVGTVTRMLLGSVADRISHIAKVPVLIAK
jgi:nucleotide-binding universal stress UspA family protein